MLEIESGKAYLYHMDQLPLCSSSAPQAELGPSGTLPHVAIAPGLRDQQHVVIRAEDDTDEDYSARSRLLAAVLALPVNE
jgi:hypothetical protein